MWISGQNKYPSDVNEIDFRYNQGTQLRDPSMTEIADYYRRIVNWYVNGGFTDECGTYHYSGHHWPIELWEVLNEPELEHQFTPELYNKFYDAITAAIREVAPKIQFVGGGLINKTIDWVETFMDSSKHTPGTELGWLSYHHYGWPDPNVTDEQEQATSSFQQMDDFILQVQKINQVRARLNPGMRIGFGEIGTILQKAGIHITPGYVISDEYWVWSASVFAYVFAKTSGLDIDAIAQSQLDGYPGQFESVSMVDYRTAEPNARYRVLEMLQKNFQAGDKLLNTTSADEKAYHAQAYRTVDGQRKLLLINKTAQNHTLTISSFNQGQAQICDVSSGSNPHRTEIVQGDEITLTPFATVILIPSC
ncbi:glycosyl hydrolases family 39 domain-containing protein [Hirsutella rhossiliensis]